MVAKKNEKLQQIGSLPKEEKEQHRKVYFDEKMNHMFYVDFDSLPQY